MKARSLLPHGAICSFQRWGAGTPTVLLSDHGYGPDWRLVSPYLGEHLTCYVLDLPSDAGDLPSVLHEFLNQQGIFRANLIASGRMTGSAYEFARRYTRRTGKVVLLGEQTLRGELLIRYAEVLSHPPSDPGLLADQILDCIGRRPCLQADLR